MSFEFAMESDKICSRLCSGHAMINKPIITNSDRKTK